MVKIKGKPVDDSPTRQWPNTYGTYISGRAAIDEADFIASEMEGKWGCDRLRLLVSCDLRERFDRQRYLFNAAIWHGKDVEAVQREAGRMVTAWKALDKAATEAGQEPLTSLGIGEVVDSLADALHDEVQREFPKFTQRPLDSMDDATGVADRFRRMARDALAKIHLSQVLEVPLDDGGVAAVVPSIAYANLVRAEGRKVAVYTVEDVARLLSHDRAIVTAKLCFPGATITAVRKQPSDPLDAFDNSFQGLDDPLDDPLPF